jgi:hypothetical protein
MWQEDPHLVFLISEIYRSFCCPSHYISLTARLVAVDIDIDIDIDM